MVRLVPIDRIDPSPDQPRHTIDGPGLDELTRSIRDHGVLQPVRVRAQDGGRYRLIAGHRRVAAARRAGLTLAPAVVVDVGDDRALIESLVENVQREDLGPIERGQALRRLRANLGTRSWQELGRIVGLSRRHVYHLLAATNLPEPMSEALRSRVITERHARALRRLRLHPELQARLWHRVLSEGTSGHEACRLAAQLLASRRADDAGAGREWPELLQAVDRVSSLLSRADPRDLHPMRRRLVELRHQLSRLAPDGGVHAEDAKE